MFIEIALAAGAVLSGIASIIALRRANHALFMITDYNNRVQAMNMPAHDPRRD